ncbi:hypothetical protein GUJ93_ZPchr0406g33339 [Zizania palustris]|uniref:Uncharacterized protein n=1 Tax=Zizania palustris TaxID=103762 RepID=A0A8J5QXK1_ZIZPA|nr:hypothetical protein GUJ93_ZPchr0406g33339 [Zizania palustris]
MALSPLPVWMHKDVLQVASLRTSHLSSSVLFCTISSKRRRRRRTSPTMASSNLAAETAQMHAFSRGGGGVGAGEDSAARCKEEGQDRQEDGKGEEEGHKTKNGSV